MGVMTRTFAPGSAQIDLPPFGSSARYLAIRYGAETRYISSPEYWTDKAIIDWWKPMYAVRVTARSI